MGSALQDSGRSQSMLTRWVDIRGKLTTDEVKRTLASVYRPDQTIDIGRPSGEGVHWYHSRFLRIGANPMEDPVVVAAPLDAHGASVLHTGDRVLVHYRLQHQGYAFESQVVDRSLERLSEAVTIPSVLLSSPQTVYHFQRREYIRVKPIKPTEAQVRWEPKAGTIAEKITKINGMVDDVSVGGCRVRVQDFRYEESEAIREVPQLTVEFTLEADKKRISICLEAEVIRAFHELQPRRFLWIAMQWEELKDAQRRVFQEYILMAEREMLRKQRMQRDESGARRPKRR